ncbi:Girdin [Rhizoctonia solani]|uniref:Girdin n=1 Tax=Rhizoctonia solani TaxID=456999 RepID=A0A0K6GIM0_9AGAM|nr:Girdin [Rhizoctonia solani]
MVTESYETSQEDNLSTKWQMPTTNKSSQKNTTNSNNNLGTGADYLHRLGLIHLERLQSQGALEELGMAIKCFEVAVALTHEGDPNLADGLTGLGAARSDRYLRLGELADLEKAVECFSRALELTPDGHPDMSRRHGNLGASYTHRYQRLGELSDLEKAMEYHSRALELIPDGHPDMSGRHAGLGTSYKDRYRRLGELADLEKAIECHSRALALTPNGHPQMFGQLANLGMSYTDRYQRLGELADLEKAIECKTRAIALAPDGHPYMSRLHGTLGVSYRDRYQRLGGQADLEKAIECHSRAVALTPDGHPDMSDRHADLGACYTDRYRRLGELADLDKMMKYHSRALELTPDGHPDMSRRYANLSASHGDRYRRLGELADLEKAIECHSRALVLTPDGHPDMSDQYANLGGSYTERYQRLGELVDLEKAIECSSRALELAPDGHPNTSNRHASLGVSYTHRYRRLGELADLEKALECFSRALELTPDGHPDISRRYATLGASYGDRYQHLGELADLEKAIEHFSRAVESTPDGHPDMSGRRSNLGLSYTYRYQRLGELGDLEKAMECHSHLLASTPNDHPDLLQQYFDHAFTTLHWYNHTSDPSHLENALQSFRKATQLSTGAPRDKFRWALKWAKLASHCPALNLIEAYQTAIDLLPQFIWLGATADQRYTDLSTTESLAIKACSAAVRSSDYSLALEWLEHARCVVWTQSVMLRSPLDLLHASHPDIATRLQTVANELHTFGYQNLTSNPAPHHITALEDVGQQRRRLAGEYNSLLEQVRQLPEFESFLKPIKTTELVRVARSGPVVVINCQGDQSDALFIFPGHNNVKHLALPTFTEDKARQARSQLETSLKHRNLRQRGVKRQGQLGYVDGMEDVLRTLWIDVVKPVLDYLGYMDTTSQEQLPHITWCPTGLLSFLPLHAAGDYSQPRSRVYNYAISSYTPTLSALITSASSSQNSSCRLLAVGQAATPGYSLLPNTTTELAHIKAHMQENIEYSQLLDDQAITTSVLDAMEQHDWVHLACHAHQNVSDPTKSGFFLHDGTLDLASINRRSFKNKGLAYLSACQTATGDKDLPDEAIHLASGMLMAGYPSVIATMWSVVDEDAPFVADKVYEQLMKDRKIGNGEAGRALHNAVAGLRLKVGEKEFGRWAGYIHIGS